MAKKYKQKKHLNFRALLSNLDDRISEFIDYRQPEKIIYSLNDCYKSAFAMFYFQDHSILEFQRKVQNTIKRNNLSTVFGVERIPKATQMRDLIDSHSYEPLLNVFTDYFIRLQRSKVHEQFRFLDKYYLLTIDGSEYFSSESINCVHCLQKTSKGITRYHHQILQATIVHPDKRIVLPFAPEFIRNNDGNKKQDCELNAAKRLIEKTKTRHPQLSLIIVGDALYSKQPFILKLKEKGFSYILVAKPTSHQYLFQEIEGLREANLLEHFEYTDKKGKRYLYEWTNKVRLNGQKDAPATNFVEFSIFNKVGKRTYHNSWVTDIEITQEIVKELVRGGRARWKIENEGFNTLKNHGYHLEHNFGHGKAHLSEAFFLLNLLAFYFHQIFQLCDELYQDCRKGFGARVEYWNTIRVTFRLLIFESWEQLLKRIHDPPI